MINCKCNGLYVLDTSDSTTAPICFDCRLPKEDKNWRKEIKQLRSEGNKPFEKSLEGKDK